MNYTQRTAAVLLGAVFLFGGAGTVSAETRFPLVIQGVTTTLTVQVELADTGEKRRIGLMHRKSLAPLAGMLFDYKREQPIAMWMKNTLIPLDMIFADRRGRIVYIKEQAQPGDLSIVTTDIPVLAVLEMAGGFASAYNLQVGDRLIHTIFDK